MAAASGAMMLGAGTAAPTPNTIKKCAVKET
jgi:hypothetical protein